MYEVVLILEAVEREAAFGDGLLMDLPKIKPLPEDFGTMDHIHEAARLYCDMMKIFEIDIKLMGINVGPTSGMMEKILAEQRLMD